MRIGIVCPYSLDTPGGVQNHVKDLAEALLARGHHVSVLAPTDETDLPAYVVRAGRAVPVPYNGSVARVSFGPVVAARVRRWLKEGDFDVLHLHEPATPSISLLALWAAECPVVATFHTSNVRSRAMSASAAILRPSMEKVAARIAVSELAREMLVNHVGGEPVVIPNGIYVDAYERAAQRPDWRGSQGTVAFVGRIDEPRKGFPLAAEAFTRLARDRPGLRLLVVGGGDTAAAGGLFPPEVRARVDLLGPVPDADKASALRTADVYVAPNTGGESFGIVLIEAMAAGTAVLASDLPAFARVLEGGRYGELFRSEDVDDLARRLGDLLDDPDRRATLTAAARVGARRYDWSSVADRILQVYETVTEADR
ncbi:glycosyltransferase family 4 protein [Nocardioides mesophilus]|uniref:Glycosyltransferase family 4 protein n=1 Tax=Nocardioides mesophilus TaxID=433659 RepID=A0A7G9RA84_9ACTN|nr:glycosyltransferase family 4 protein [Nocardioides mesophilus]QNN52509.1 glycosyltransferase family 4 protein [Nocardioides mesophilus]